MGKLDTMTVEELKREFTLQALASPFEMPAEASEIVAEMKRRGYEYDSRYRDFVTCQEWNRRHGDWSPKDCAE